MKWYTGLYAHSQVHLSMIPFKFKVIYTASDKNQRRGKAGYEASMIQFKFKGTSCSIHLYKFQSADFIPCLVSTLQLT